MEEGKPAKSHLTSAAAFVEGGIQDACDDACSICLEEFCESDPSTVSWERDSLGLLCIFLGTPVTYDYVCPAGD